jgi:hypothetical protein
MSNLFGLDAELERKNKEKYSTEREFQAREWLERVAQVPRSEEDFNDWLRDGLVLIKSANQLGLTKAKPNTSKLAFKQMENIGNFLMACDEAGVRRSEQFQTVDLFEGKNMVESVICLT